MTTGGLVGKWKMNDPDWARVAADLKSGVSVPLIVPCDGIAGFIPPGQGHIVPLGEMRFIDWGTGRIVGDRKDSWLLRLKRWLAAFPKP